jgi:hypothetical protein
VITNLGERARRLSPFLLPLMEKLVFAPPLKGYIDGLDPASPLFPPEGAPDLENIRTQGGLWGTRLGMSLWQTLPGSGACRLVPSYYKSDGTVRRLAAQGTTLYQSSGSTFTAAAGGSAILHASNPIRGAMLRDYLYFVDGSGALRKYNLSGVASVAQPSAPSQAPTATRQTFKVLDDWSTLSNWTASSGNFTRTEVSGSFTDDSPLGGNILQLHWAASGAKGQTITFDVANEVLASNTIACYVQGEKTKPRVNFEIGANTATDLPFPISGPDKNEWSLFFMNLGGATKINHKRFRCVKPDGGGNLYLSKLLLPGNLLGPYRWRYTHYNSTTGAESQPSSASDFADFSTVGTNARPETASALQKSASLALKSDGTGAGTDKIRVYRNGGVPSLTTDAFGQEIWTLVEEISDTGTSAGDAITYVDNSSDSSIAGNIFLDVERNDAPSGAAWISVSPDERLWLAYASGQVCVSNRRTPERLNDHEVFPQNVDPLTRGSLLQGWSFYVGGEAGGDQIVWAGFFQGTYTVLTQKALYQVHAASQAEWGPTTVQKVVDVGCLAGETVAEVNGTLIWVTDGPKVIRWDGGGPRDLSYQRVSTTLQAAPSANWSSWFARAHSDVYGAHYRLWIVPSGGSTPTRRLDWNVVGDAWEPQVHYDSGGTALPWGSALVRNGAGDFKELYAVHPTNGKIYQLETGSTDDGQAIRIRFKTPKKALAALGQLETLYLRLAGVSDALTVTPTLGGSEYRQRSGVTDIGDPTAAYAVTLSGTGDEEFKKRTDYTLLKGRWLQVQVSGSVSNRPAVRELHGYYQPVREERIS